jgi:tRNA modification GTPase
VEQLEGALSNQFNQLYESVLHIASDLESTLDFPDDELPQVVFPELADRLQSIRVELLSLIDTWDEGQLLREGAVLVIAGKPNAGKSTLMNALLGADRAIVSSTPGTTRDTIEEGLVLDGIPLRLVDTAGLRETDCEIEQEGIRRTHRHVASSDLQVLILDSSQPLDDTDRDHLAALDPTRSLVVRNKADLGAVPAAPELDAFTVVETSLLRGEGLEALRQAIRGKIEGTLDLEARPHAVISERHRGLLLAALTEVDQAMKPILAGDEAQTVVAASLLRDALEWIGQATGRVYQEDLLDTIFSRFCIGK